MRDDDVGAGLGHRDRLVRVEDVGRGQEVELAGLADHVDLEAKAHAGLLEALAHRAVEEADRRKILHAGEADPFNSARNCGISTNGSVPLTPASTGVCLTTGRTSRAISLTISLALP